MVNYEELADFIIQFNKGDECVHCCAAIANKCDSNNKNCVKGLATYLYTRFETDYICMTPSEIARHMNTETTDEQFAEVFALLDMAQNDRGIPMMYDTKQVIKNMDVDGLMKRLGNILKEVQQNIEDGD